MPVNVKLRNDIEKVLETLDLDPIVVKNIVVDIMDVIAFHMPHPTTPHHPTTEVLQ
jgi:hypothetical protein